MLNFYKPKPKPIIDAYHSFSTHEEEKIKQKSNGVYESSNKSSKKKIDPKSLLEGGNWSEEDSDLEDTDLASLKGGNQTDKLVELALNLILKKVEFLLFYSHPN